MSEGLDTLRVRAAGGDRRAQTDLGKKLLFAEDVAPAPQQGIALILEAAKQGDGEALSLAARLAAWGVMQPRNAAGALDLLEKSAEAGWGPARVELRFLAGSEGDDWVALRRSVDVAARLKPPAPQLLFEKPRMLVYREFATLAECDWIIARVRGDLQRAMVNRGKARPQIADTRTNSEAGLMLKISDVAMSFVRDRIVTALGIGAEFCEVAKVLHYSPGQMFKHHFDFLDTSAPELRGEVERHGQRLATFLIYLTDDYEEGETDFPKASFRFKGRKGDGLLFFNVDVSGAPEPMSYHAGLPPASGEKWVLSQWISSRSINAFMTPGATPAPLGPDWLRSF